MPDYDYDCGSANNLSFDEDATKKADELMDSCVRCGKETPYDKSTPVTFRLYFVEGAGQLCPDCWRKLYERVNQPGVNDSTERVGQRHDGMHKM